MAILFTDLVGNPYKLEDLEGFINLKSYIYTIDQNAVDPNSGNEDVVRFDTLKINACDTNYFERNFNEMDRFHENGIGRLVNYFTCIEEPDNLKVVGSD